MAAIASSNFNEQHVCYNCVECKSTIFGALMVSIFELNFPNVPRKPCMKMGKVQTHTGHKVKIRRNSGSNCVNNEGAMHRRRSVKAYDYRCRYSSSTKLKTQFFLHYRYCGKRSNKKRTNSLCTKGNSDIEAEYVLKSHIEESCNPE